jgi:outer membrane protein TolC
MDLLTQAEHDLLYGVRDFTQFRKQFTVDIASEYYGVLGARDQVRNYFRNYQNSVQMNERASELAREGRTTQTEMGRFEQQVLDAESNWINAIRTYKQSLDGFKVRLGTSADTRIVLDEQDLSTLTIRHPDVKVEDAIQVALKARLDYQNAMGRVDDAQRRVRLAIDNLKPQMDLVAGVSLSSDPNKTSGFAYPELQRYHWNAGLDLDIPLDRLEKRNIYRSSLINEAQAERAVMQLGDEIGLEVRDNWRLLEQARRTYEISEAGVKLAERRVEEQNLLAELGRARALDQVDAQNSLLSSRNQRTQALVGHTIARLRFWNSMGILYVKDNGQWKEIPDAVN